MKKHLLIVDDEAEIRDLLGEFLTLQGYRTTIAASTDEAQKAVTRDAPDLIICDLQLDDSDGLTLIQQLKKAIPTTPVLLLTGVYFEPSVVRDVLSKTVAAYLYKTTPLKEILATVEQLVGKSGD
jgi:DNA-binding response OmpR family regulator